MKPDVDVAIIGAGFAGLGAAVRLKQRGQTSFLVFERAAEVGGTWRDNVYPGCACDVPSHLYSLSFAPNPNWSRMYSTQPEILDYLKHVVATYQLAPAIRYNTAIIRTEFSEEDAFWTLTDHRGNQTTARVVIGAIGPLNRPSLPTIAGMDSFAGRAFHSSNWDSTCDFTGKRVAVIGTGASAIQIVPQLALVAGQLTVFQRTAPYVTPRMDRAISAREQRLFRRMPIVQKTYRSFIYWLNELRGLSFLGNETFNRLGTKEALKHLNAAIKDPVLRARVTPDYKLGCKRVLVSDDYYPALTRPNVELVTDRIDRATPAGIVTTDGTERPFDYIIFGTGFVASEIICDLHIVGRKGHNLFDQWLETGPEAHYGITASGYPNLLFLVGPNTGLGHTSIIHMIESQVQYVLGYLDLLDRAGPGAFLDVKAEAQKEYNAGIQQKLAGTVWASGCQSWYMDSRGKNTTLWPALTVTYRQATRRVNPAHYDVVRVGNREALPA
ncbi:flavin-containing monooxygenase [Spirosoma rigui]|uniref:flavin-containing monooxygenase n=1 Tax=Spirosoma rigui TaxID=564064 RepID=UPI0009B11743|nr:NAD(P)/FAD-dependent oxidoreductase [Spirosoma rigui]